MKPFALDQPLAQGVALLEASAGTGKTFSIAGLALRLIAERDIKVSELLIVTFTRAATAELASRIHQRLLDGARELRAHALAHSQDEPPPKVDDPVISALVHEVSDDELQRRLLRVMTALASFDEASISTIHGFCQRALQSAAFESASEFELEMEADLGPLVDECIDDFMASNFVKAPDSFYTCTRGLGGFDRDQLALLAKALQADPGAQVLPKVVRPSLELHQLALSEFSDAWKREGHDFTRALIKASAAKTVTFESPAAYQKGKVNSAFGAIDKWVAAVCSGQMLPPVAAKDFVLLSRRTLNDAHSDGELPESQIPDLIDRLIYPPLTSLRVEFANTFRESLAQKKAELGIQAFDDQIRGLHEALSDPLRGPALRESIRKDYSAALIDESQDTDALQWSIFRSLFGDEGRPLYLIGDPKQSIYRFRGADIATYLEARGQAGEQVFGLETNWRSDGPLVDALNSLYARNPTLAQGISVPPVNTAPGYEHSALRNTSVSAPVLLRHFPQDLAGPSNRGKAPFSADFKATTVLAAWVASEVRRLLGEGIEIEVGPNRAQAQAKLRRPLHASDIAILTNSNREAADIESELRLRGIPCVRGGHGSVFESTAAKSIGLWMQAVHEVRRAGHMSALLVGPLVGLQARELDELGELAWEDWNEHLSAWRKRWHERGFHDAWRHFCSHVKLEPKILARRGGARFWTDLQHLAELLHAAESEGALRAGSLIRWYSRWPEKSTQTSDDHKIRLARDDEAVQISTVHASKGLEYSIVLCPSAWKSAWPIKDTNLRVRDAEQDPPWLLDLRDAKSSTTKSDYVDIAKRAADEEQARLNYVAMTRAKHQLILYWGAFEGATEGPLASLLFAQTPPEELRELDDEQRLELLEGLESELKGNIAIVPRGDLDLESPYSPTTKLRPEDLSPASFTRARVDRDWRRASYSSLSRNATYDSLEHLDDANPEVAGVDHDEFVEAKAVAKFMKDGTPPQADDSTPEDYGTNQVPLAGFTRGKEAGTFLHEILEFLDFQRLGDQFYVRELCETKLRKHGLDEAQGPKLASSLSKAMQTPLGAVLGDWSLAELPHADRIDEMQFDLPLAGGYASVPAAGSRERPAQIKGEDIARLFAEHRIASPAMPQGAIDHYASLRFERPVRGFLTGAIDLFFRVPDAGGKGPLEARYFLADYKSNWLGDADRKRSTFAHYESDALASAMVHHDYHLQYHLYVLATHRYLRARLGDGYDYERNFGGVYYLFLRGMAGRDAQRKGSESLAPGVFFDRPPLAFVDALDELFRAGGQAS